MKTEPVDMKYQDFINPVPIRACIESTSGTLLEAAHFLLDEMFSKYSTPEFLVLDFSKINGYLVEIYGESRHCSRFALEDLEQFERFNKV